MSIYDAEQYWKERRKTAGKNKCRLLLLAVVLFAAGAAVIHSRRNNGVSAQRRQLADATAMQWSECESSVNSKRECQSICINERNSVNQRALESCLTGCQSGHATSVAISCRGKVTSEADMFDEVGGLAYLSCAAYQLVPPKPETFATCRKYHRAGLKSGFRAGLSSLQRILEDEFEKQKNTIATDNEH